LAVARKSTSIPNATYLKQVAGKLRCVVWMWFKDDDEFLIGGQSMTQNKYSLS
jgi:hypothetical protein